MSVVHRPELSATFVEGQQYDEVDSLICTTSSMMVKVEGNTVFSALLSFF